MALRQAAQALDRYATTIEATAEADADTSEKPYALSSGACGRMAAMAGVHCFARSGPTKRSGVSRAKVTRRRCAAGGPRSTRSSGKRRWWRRRA